MNSLGGKKAMPLGQAVSAYLKMSHLSSGMNTHLIYSAWDKVTGLSAYTLKKYLRDGKLYVTVSSSVIASQLGFQKDIIIDRINETLDSEPLYTKDDPLVGHIRELIIK